MIELLDYPFGLFRCNVNEWASYLNCDLFCVDCILI